MERVTRRVSMEHGELRAMKRVLVNIVNIVISRQDSARNVVPDIGTQTVTEHVS